MTAAICRVEGLDLASDEMAITQENRIAKEYRIMSSPDTAPEANPRGIFPRIEGDDNKYVMVPYSEIAKGLARGRTSPWIPISMVMTWIVLSAVAMLVVKSRTGEQALQSASQSQTQTILKLASSIGAQREQVVKLTNSVQTLTGAVSSLSATIRATESRVNRSAREVRRVEARLRAAEMRLNAQPSQP
jgi:hypothetical protein